MPTRKKTPKKSTSTNKVTAKKKPISRTMTAGESVREEMHAMHEGELESGRSGRKVTNPKQAIAIGLSEARRSGKNVPPKPTGGGRKKKSR